MNLSVEQSGPPSTARAGTVVFVHGFPFDASMWAGQLGSLPEGWRGLAPDLRGFGRTELHAVPGEVSTGNRIGGRIARPDEPVLTMARLADDVADLIGREVGVPAVVCGLSMGGYVVLELWRRNPSAIRGLVLADTRATADSDEARENRMRTAQVARRYGVGPVADAMLPDLLSKTSADRHPDLARRVRTMITGTRPETLIAALAGMASRHDAYSDLPGITVPTLVVVGEDDAITPSGESREMAERIPGARIVLIPDAGHLSPLENPDAFNRALTGFLQAL